MNNNNQALIDSLRQAADYLEAHPAAMKFGEQRLMHLVFDKDEFLAASKTFGSYEKVIDGNWVSMRHRVSDALTIGIEISRDQICEKIVTYKCPDESWLKEFEVSR